MRSAHMVFFLIGVINISFGWQKTGSTRMESIQANNIHKWNERIRVNWKNNETDTTPKAINELDK